MANRKGDEIDRVAALLVLYGSLAWAEQNGMAATAHGPAVWDRAVRHLCPREICVLALHGIRGETHERIGEWLGGLSRGMSSLLWERATRKLRDTATELVA